MALFLWSSLVLAGASCERPPQEVGPDDTGSLDAELADETETAEVDGELDRDDDGASELETDVDTGLCGGVRCADGIDCVAGRCGQVLQLALSRGPRCALLATGEVLCWGSLGDGEGEHRMPVPVGGLDDAVEIAVGGEQGCARRRDGSVACWGRRYSELSDPPVAVPLVAEPVETLSNAIQIAVGSRHACALLASGTVECWGSNQWGQLGTGEWGGGSLPNEVVVELMPGLRGPLIGVVELRAGPAHTCARGAHGEVWCWGENTDGRLGDGSTHLRDHAVRVPGLAPAQSLALGSGFTCVVVDSGKGYCWGAVGVFALGREVPSPQRAAAFDGAERLTAGENHVCMLRDGGELACVGANLEGQLGVEGIEGSASPVVLPALAQPRELACGGDASCVVAADGRVLCWGDRGRFDDWTATPVQVASTRHFVELQVGGYHSCGRDDESRWWCWGANHYGQIDADLGHEVPAPVELVERRGEPLALGGWFTCALGAGGVQCWGDSLWGQCGVVQQQSRPAPIAPLPPIERVRAAGTFACALSAAGEAWCWGENYSGQLGVTEPKIAPQPLAVALGAGVRELDGSWSAACAILDDDSLWCWGDNAFDQLGDAPLPEGNPPAVLPGLSELRSVALGSEHTCVLHDDGSVSCWGNNERGALGDGRPGDRTTRARALVDEVVELHVGLATSCARRSDGSIWCWGDGRNGITGDSAEARPVPVRVSGIDAAVGLGVGYEHACALRDDGSVWCWGSRGAGVLGDDQRHPTEPQTVVGLNTPRCGDGARSGAEACDDGNALAGDGCAPDCTLEAGFSCDDDGRCRRDVAGDRCEQPLPSTQYGDFADFANDYDPSTDCSLKCASGNDAVYELRLEPGEGVRLVAKSEADVVLWVGEGCDAFAGSCFSVSDSMLAGGFEDIEFSYEGSGTATYLVVVDSYAPGGGSFELQAERL